MAPRVPDNRVDEGTAALPPGFFAAIRSGSPGILLSGIAQLPRNHCVASLFRSRGIEGSHAHRQQNRVYVAGCGGSQHG